MQNNGSLSMALNSLQQKEQSYKEEIRKLTN